MKKVFLVFMFVLALAFSALSQSVTYQTNGRNVHFNKANQTGVGYPGGLVKLDSGIVAGGDTLYFIGIPGSGNVVHMSATGGVYLDSVSRDGGSQNLQQTLDNGNSAISDFNLSKGQASITNIPLFSGSVPFTGFKRPYNGYIGLNGFADLSAFTSDSANIYLGFSDFSSLLHGVSVGIIDSSVVLNSKKDVFIQSGGGASIISQNEINLTTNEASIGIDNKRVDINTNNGSYEGASSHNLSNTDKVVISALRKSQEWEVGFAAIDNTIDQPYSNIYYGTLDSNNAITDMTRVQADFQKAEIISDMQGAGIRVWNNRFIEMWSDSMELRGLQNGTNINATVLSRNPNTNKLEWQIPNKTTIVSIDYGNILPLASGGQVITTGTGSGTASVDLLPSIEVGSLVFISDLANNAATHNIQVDAGSGNSILRGDGTPASQELLIDSSGYSYTLRKMTSTQWMVIGTNQ